LLGVAASTQLGPLGVELRRQVTDQFPRKQRPRNFEIRVNRYVLARAPALLAVLVGWRAE